MSWAKLLLLAGSLLAGVSVALGAFAAHAQISAEMLANFQTGVRYQSIHAVALLTLGMLLACSAQTGIGISRWLLTAGLLLLIGIVLFSGSLYLLALTGPGWPALLTPLGGMALLCGWLFAFIGVLRSKL